MSHLLAALHRRLQHKLVAGAPIIAGTLVVVGGFSVVTYAIQLHLPATYRHLLQHAWQGDWTSRGPVPLLLTMPLAAPLPALPALSTHSPVHPCH